MRSLFHSFKLQCARCAAYCGSGSSANPKDASYCSQCGLLVGSPPHEAIFKQAYWLPADDEIAVFFAVESLAKLAKDGVQIPARARAYVLQNDRSVELFSGSYDAQSLRARTNVLNPDQAVDLLITRSHPLALNFVFDDLHSSEFLPITASVLLRVKIDQIVQFAHQFMLTPGTLNTAQLQALLAPMVRQALLSVVRAKSLRAMQDDVDFYAQLDEQLLSTLNQRLSNYGLALTQLITQQLQHVKLSNDREVLSENTELQVLQLDASRAQLEHTKQADDLYREREWQRVSKQEEQVRLRYRHEEMRAQFAKDLGWLYLQGDYDKAKKRLSRAKLQQDEAERLQTIRLRELDLYAQVTEAASRQQAIDAGAGETVRALEHDLKEKNEIRQNEADQWLHVRTLARIKMRSESELTQLHSKQAAQLLQLQSAQQLQKIQLEHEIAQNQLIADKAQQASQLELQRQQQQSLQQAEQELEDERQKHRLMSISLETELRAREFQRMQAWEQELHKTRVDDLQREQQIKEMDAAFKLAQVQEQINSIQQREEQARITTQQEKLQRTIELHARFRDQEQQRQEQAALAVFAIEESRMKLQLQAEQQAWDRQQQSLEKQQQHQIAMEKTQIERLQAIANFSETGKIATADVANANALAEVMKLQTQAGMSAEQILAAQAGQSSHAAQAMSAMAQIQHGMSLEQSMKMLQERLREEREQREADQQRRHEIDLSIVQNLMPLQRPHASSVGRK